jgi:hypothetical protein
MCLEELRNITKINKQNSGLAAISQQPPTLLIDSHSISSLVSTLHLCSHGTNDTENTDILLSRAFMLRPLPGNVRCLQSPLSNGSTCYSILQIKTRFIISEIKVCIRLIENSSSETFSHEVKAIHTACQTQQADWQSFSLMTTI